MKSPYKHPLEVSKAVEFEEIKKLPKFSHSHLACINPVHRSSLGGSPIRDLKIGVAGSPIKYHEKEIFQKILPDHLIKPPIEVLRHSTSKERSAEDIIRKIEYREGRKLNSKETRDIFEKKRK